MDRVAIMRMSLLAISLSGSTILSSDSASALFELLSSAKPRASTT